MSDSPSGPGERTELQPESSQAKAQELSIPKDVQQHPEAPKIPGYVLISPIGRGAYAQVWKAWQLRTHKWVAIKVFIQKSGVDWLFLQREVERLIRLDKHPHIVSLLDAGLNAEPPYYVMDFMDGGSLERHVSPKNPAPVDKAVMWMEEICRALAYVHSKGLIHCDLKPANVLIDEEGHVRLADFGQSRIMTDSAGALGTLFYMAPEQAVLPKEGEPLQPDVRWDVYGVGTTMWAILTGRVPRSDYETKLKLEQAGSLDERLKEYRRMVAAQPLQACREATAGRADEDLAVIVDKCVQAKPDLRHAAARDVGDDLKARREQMPVSPLWDRRGYRVKKFVLRNAALASVGAVAVAMFAMTGTQMVRERNSANAKLAFSYVVRAQQFAKDGDDASAAIYYAESNRLAPTNLARANALAFSANLAVPRMVFNHQGEVLRVALSADGKIALTGGTKTALLWDTQTGEPLGKALRHDGRPSGGPLAIAVAADGKTVLTGGWDDTVRLWYAHTGKPIGGVIQHQYMAAVAFSPDLKVVLTGSGDKTVRLWDARTGKPIGKEMRHDNAVTAAALSQDGKAALTGGSDKTARLWDSATGAPIGKVMQHEEKVSAVAFSPDGKTALTGSWDKTARLWDARTGKPIGKSMEHGGRVEAVAFSPDGKTALTRSADGAARLWDAKTGESVGKYIWHGGGVLSAVFSPDGKTVLTGGWDNTARFWDAKTDDPVGGVMGHEGWVMDVAFGADGRTVFTGSWDNTARLWDARTGEPAGKVTRRPGDTARLWDPRTVEPIGKVTRHDDRWKDALAFALRKDAPTASDEPARLWAAKEGERAAIRQELKVLAVAFSQDGKTVITGTWDKAARLWDAQTGEPIGKVMRHENAVYAVAFSPDGKTALTGSDDKTARLWDARTGEPMGKVMHHEGGVVAVAFSPDGGNALTGGLDKTARLWNARTGEPLGKTMRHEAAVHAVAFGPDGKAVLTTSGDGMARLWDAATGEPVGKAMRHEAAVSAFAFSPDGKAVLTGSGKTARLWDAATGEPIGKALQLDGPVEAVAFSQDGKALLTGNRLDDDWKLALMAAHAEAPLSESPARTARIWDVSWIGAQVQPDRLLLDVRTGRRITDSGDIEEIPADDYIKLFKRYRRTAREE